MKTHKQTPLSKCRTKRISSTRKKLIKGTFKIAMTIEDVGDDTAMESGGSGIIESAESGTTGGSGIIESAESGETETFDDVFIISSSMCSGESEEKRASSRKPGYAGESEEKLLSEKSGCAGENEEYHSSPEKFRCAEVKQDEWSLKNLFEDSDGSTTKGEMNDILESPRRRSFPGSKSPKRNILCSTMIESPEMPFSQFLEESDIPSSISVKGKIAGIQHQCVSNQKTKLPQIDQLSETSSVAVTFLHKGIKGKSFPMEILEQNLQKKNANKVHLGIKKNLPSVKITQLNNCKEVSSKPTHKKDFYEALRDQLLERSSFEEVFHKSRKAKSFPIKTVKQNIQKNNTNKVPLEMETNLPSVDRTPPNTCTGVLSKSTNEDFDEALCAHTLSEMSSKEKTIHDMRKSKPSQVEKNKVLRKKITNVPLKIKRKLPPLTIAPVSKYKKSLPKSSSARDLCETPRVSQRTEKHLARKNLLYEEFKPNSERVKSTKETNQDMQERISSNTLSSTKPYDHLVDLTYNIKSGGKCWGIPSKTAERSDEDPLSAERSKEDPLANYGNTKNRDGTKQKTKKHPKDGIINKNVPKEKRVSKIRLKIKRKAPSLNKAPFSKCKQLTKTSNTGDLRQTARVLDKAAKHNSEKDESTKKINENVLERRTSNSISFTIPFEHPEEQICLIKSVEKDRSNLYRTIEKNKEGTQQKKCVIDCGKTKKNSGTKQKITEHPKRKKTNTDVFVEEIVSTIPSSEVGDLLVYSETEDSIGAPLRILGKNSEARVTDFENSNKTDEMKQERKKHCKKTMANKDVLEEEIASRVSTSELLDNYIYQFEPVEIVRTPLQVTGKNSESKMVKKRADLQTLQDKNAKTNLKKNSKREVTNQKYSLSKQKKGIAQEITSLKKKRKKITMLRTINQATLEKKSHNILSSFSIISGHSTESIAVPVSEENVEQSSSLKHTDTEEEMKDMLEGHFSDKTKTSKSKKKKYKNNKAKAGSSRAKTVSVEEDIGAYKEYLKTVEYDDLSLLKWLV